MIRKLFLSVAAAVVMLAMHSVARADTVVIGPGQYGSTATITGYTLTNNGNGTSTFTFTVNNTASTGSITAIGFNLTGSNLGDFELTTPGSSAFQLGENVKAQAGAQNFTKVFDFALLTGKTYGGGTVADGVLAGTSATFTVTGNFNGMSAQQIAQAIFLRYQGIGPNDLSEVIGPGTPGNPGAPIPEPMTMLLFGTGLAGVAAKVRKRRKMAASQE